MIRVIADEVLDLPSATAALLDLVRVPAGKVQPARLRGADALLVRSVTTVNAALLEASSVRFVGTATAGTDHVDLDYLKRRGIRFAAAPGCNAASVADFVCATIMRYLAATGRGLDRVKLGIVGFGQTGSRVHARLAPLAAACAVYDPFLAAPGAVGSPGDLVDCDIITLHVPLTHTGPAPTKGMIGRDFCDSLAPGSLLINAARGAVLAPAVFSIAPERLWLAIDVWENEPIVDPVAVARAWQATPHIAGHTVDARARGGRMIWRALCDFFNLPWPVAESATPAGRPGGLDSPEAHPDHDLAQIVAWTGDPDETALATVERAAGLSAMSSRFQAEIVQAAAAARPLELVFTGLRARCGGRREFGIHRTLWRGDRTEGELLRQLGFQVIYRAK